MKIFRRDGSPINLEKYKERNEEMKTAFYELEKRIGKFDFTKPEIVEEYQKVLGDIDRSIQDAYPIFETVHYPKSEAALRKLITKYGGAICFCEEDGVITAYIMTA